MSTPGGWSAPGQEPTDNAPRPNDQPPPPQTGHIPPAGPPPQQGFQAPRPTTYQPGVIPFRPLTLGDLYGAAFKIIKGNPASTVGIALILALIALIPTTPLGLWVSNLGSASVVFDPTVTPGADAGTGADFLLVFLGQMIPSIAGSLAIIPLAGFIAYVTGQAVMGRKVKLPETWQGTKPHVLRVIGVSLLVSLAMALLTAAFLAPGVIVFLMGATQSDDGLLAIGVLLFLGLGLLLVLAYLFLWTRVAFVGPAVVLEGQGIWGSVRRSWRLTRFSGFWRILGIRLLTMLLVGLVAQILTTPLSFLLAAGMFATGLDPAAMVTLQVLMSALVTLITVAATTPVSATVDTLLYVDHRMRDEALDVQLIQAVEGHAPLPWLPATDPQATVPQASGRR